MSSRLHAQEDVQGSLQGLSNKWEELKHKMAERGDQLQKARQQAQLLRLLQVSWGDRAREGDSACTEPGRVGAGRTGGGAVEQESGVFY